MLRASSLVVSVVAVVVILGVNGALGQTTTFKWTNPDGGDWSYFRNWENYEVPSGYTAQSIDLTALGSGSTITVNVFPHCIEANLKVGGGTIHLRADLRVKSLTTGTDTITITSGAVGENFGLYVAEDTVVGGNVVFKSAKINFAKSLVVAGSLLRLESPEGVPSMQTTSLAVSGDLNFTIPAVFNFVLGTNRETAPFFSCDRLGFPSKVGNDSVLLTVQKGASYTGVDAYIFLGYAVDGSIPSSIATDLIGSNGTLFRPRDSLFFFTFWDAAPMSFKWMGGSSKWSDGSNWDAGVVPPSGFDAGQGVGVFDIDLLSLSSAETIDVDVPVYLPFATMRTKDGTLDLSYDAFFLGWTPDETNTLFSVKSSTGAELVIDNSMTVEGTIVIDSCTVKFESSLSIDGQLSLVGSASNDAILDVASGNVTLNGTMAFSFVRRGFAPQVVTKWLLMESNAKLSFSKGVGFYGACVDVPFALVSGGTVPSALTPYADPAGTVIDSYHSSVIADVIQFDLADCGPISTYTYLSGMWSNETSWAEGAVPSISHGQITTIDLTALSGSLVLDRTVDCSGDLVVKEGVLQLNSGLYVGTLSRMPSAQNFTLQGPRDAFVVFPAQDQNMTVSDPLVLDSVDLTISTNVLIASELTMVGRSHLNLISHPSSGTHARNATYELEFTGSLYMRLDNTPARIEAGRITAGAGANWDISLSASYTGDVCADIMIAHLLKTSDPSDLALLTVTGGTIATFENYIFFRSSACAIPQGTNFTELVNSQEQVEILEFNMGAGGDFDVADNWLFNGTSNSSINVRALDADWFKSIDATILGISSTLTVNMPVSAVSATLLTKDGTLDLQEPLTVGAWVPSGTLSILNGRLMVDNFGGGQIVINSPLRVIADLSVLGGSLVVNSTLTLMAGTVMVWDTLTITAYGRIDVLLGSEESLIRCGTLVVEDGARLNVTKLPDYAGPTTLVPIGSIFSRAIGFPLLEVIPPGGVVHWNDSSTVHSPTEVLFSFGSGHPTSFVLNVAEGKWNEPSSWSSGVVPPIPGRDASVAEIAANNAITSINLATLTGVLLLSAPVDGRKVFSYPSCVLSTDGGSIELSGVDLKVSAVSLTAGKSFEVVSENHQLSLGTAMTIPTGSLLTVRGSDLFVDALVDVVGSGRIVLSPTETAHSSLVAQTLSLSATATLELGLASSVRSSFVWVSGSISFAGGATIVLDRGANYTGRCDMIWLGRAQSVTGLASAVVSGGTVAWDSSSKGLFAQLDGCHCATFNPSMPSGSHPFTFSLSDAANWQGSGPPSILDSYEITMLDFSRLDWLDATDIIVFDVLVVAPQATLLVRNGQGILSLGNDLLVKEWTLGGGDLALPARLTGNGHSLILFGEHVFNQSVHLTTVRMEVDGNVDIHAGVNVTLEGSATEKAFLIAEKNITVSGGLICRVQVKDFSCEFAAEYVIFSASGRFLFEKLPNYVGLTRDVSLGYAWKGIVVDTSSKNPWGMPGSATPELVQEDYEIDLFNNGGKVKYTWESRQLTWSASTPPSSPSEDGDDNLALKLLITIPVAIFIFGCVLWALFLCFCGIKVYRWFMRMRKKDKEKYKRAKEEWDAAVEQGEEPPAKHQNKYVAKSMEVKEQAVTTVRGWFSNINKANAPRPELSSGSDEHKATPKSRDTLAGWSAAPVESEAPVGDPGKTGKYFTDSWGQVIELTEEV